MLCRLFSSLSEQGLLFIAARRFLIWGASLVAKHGLYDAQAQYPAFASNTLFFLHAQSEVAVGFFGLFVSVVHNLPRLHRYAVIFSPI